MLTFAPPMPARWYVEENGSAAILTAKGLAGVAPEVNLRECVTCIPPLSANNSAHSGFETQSRHHQMSETGYQWPQKWTCVLQIFLKK